MSRCDRAEANDVDGQDGVQSGDPDHLAQRANRESFVLGQQHVGRGSSDCIPA